MFAMAIEDFQDYNTSADIRRQFAYVGNLWSKIQKDLAHHAAISDTYQKLKLFNLVINQFNENLEEVINAGHSLTLPFELDLFLHKNTPNLETDLDDVLKRLRKRKVSVFSRFQFNRLIKSYELACENLIKLCHTLKTLSKLDDWDRNLIEAYKDTQSTSEFFSASKITLTPEDCRNFVEDLVDKAEKPNQALLEAAKSYKAFLAVK